MSCPSHKDLSPTKMTCALPQSNLLQIHASSHKVIHPPRRTHPISHGHACVPKYWLLWQAKALKEMFSSTTCAPFHKDTSPALTRLIPERLLPLGLTPPSRIHFHHQGHTLSHKDTPHIRRKHLLTQGHTYSHKDMPQAKTHFLHESQASQYEDMPYPAKTHPLMDMPPPIST